MKNVLFILLLFFSCTSKKKCPTNLSKYIQHCREIECIQDQSSLIQKVFKTEHEFKTQVNVYREDKMCHVDFLSEWTGLQACRFPKKFADKIGQVLGDNEDRDGIRIYQALRKMSKANDLSELKEGMDKIQKIENKNLEKQVKIQKMHKEHPIIAKRWKGMCKRDPSKADEFKLKTHQKMMKKMTESISKLQLEVDKKFNNFSK